MTIASGTSALSSYAASVTSELMTNHVPARAVDAQRAFDVAEDANGDPIAFAIGTDHTLRVITVDPGGPSGWKAVSIAPPGSGAITTAFGITQDADGTITLALSTADSTDGPATVFVSPGLSNNPAVTDWTAVAPTMVARPGATPAAVTDLLLGAGSQGSAPLIVAVVDEGGTTRRYRVNADTKNTTWSQTPFVFPESVNENGVLDLAVGSMFGKQGVYALYKVGVAVSLEFTSLPDPTYHKTSNYAFTVPQDSTCIDVTPGSGNSSDLYVGGNGITVFLASGSLATEVVSATEMPSVQRLLARDDGTDTSVWAITSDAEVHYLHGAGAGWSTPFPLLDNGSELAALRSRARRDNQIFFVTDANQFGYAWQDAATTIWQEVVIPLPDVGDVTTVTSYTTRIQVSDSVGAPAVGVPLEVGASSLQFVTINGASRLVGPTSAAPASTDATGCLTVITPVDSLATGVLHIVGLNGPAGSVFDVNPAAPVMTRLSAMRSAGDLSSATFASGPRAGQPVLATPPSTATLSAVTSAVSKLSDMAPSVITADRVTPTLLQAAHRDSDAPSLATLSPLSSGGESWGVRFGDTVEFLFGHDVDAILGTLGSAIEELAGDVLRWLDSAADEVSAIFVTAVDGGWRFVAQIGSAVLHMAIETVEHIAAAVEWLLKNVLGIDLADLLAWLGFIFDWDDIKLSHQVIVQMANRTVDYGEALLGELATEVSAGFEWLKQKAATLAPAGHTDQPVRSTATASATSVSSAIRTSLNGPVGSWGTYHLMHSGASSAPAPATPAASDPATAFFTDVLQPAMTTVGDTLTTIGNDLAAGLQKDASIGEMFQALGVDSIVGVLDTIEQITVGAIDCVGDIAETLRQAANAPIDVPVFSALYRSISGSQLTVLDLAGLLGAIPVTVGYKLLTGDKPFAAGDTRIADSDCGWQEAFGLLGVRTPPADQAHNAAAVSIGSGSTTPLHKAALLRSAAEPSGPEAVPASASDDAARYYSYFGGLAFLVLNAVSDVMDTIEAVTKVNDYMAGKTPDAPTTISTTSLIQFAVGLGASAGSFPVGNDPEVAVQRAIWTIDLLSNFVRMLVLKVGDKLRRMPEAERVNGGLTLAASVIVLILEFVVFGEEMANDVDEKKGIDGIKLLQNLGYGVAHGANGVGTLLPEGAKTPAALAAAASIGGLFLASVTNVVVLAMNWSGSLEHQTY